VELNGGLLLLEGRPGEKREAEIDRCRVEGINGLVQLQPQVFVAIKDPGPVDQDSGKIGVDAPIAVLVGVGQGASGDSAPEAAVIEPSWD